MTINFFLSIIIIIVIAVGKVQASLFDEEETSSGPKRGNIVMGHSRDGAHYQGNSLDLEVGGEQWSMLLTAFKSEDVEGEDFDEYNAGFGFDLNKSVDMELLIVATSATDDLKSRGLAFTTGFVISDLWQGTLASTLNIELERHSYKQQINAIGAQGRLYVTRSYTQRKTGLEFSQEISSWLSASINWSQWSYTDESEGVVKNANDVVLNTRTLNGVRGSSTKRRGWGINWSPLDWLNLSYYFDETEILDSTITNDQQSYGLSFYLGDHWELAPNYTKLISDSTSETYGATVVYSW